jgi:iron complex transport system ATP-binding protein
LKTRDSDFGIANSLLRPALPAAWHTGFLSSAPSLIEIRNVTVQRGNNVALRNLSVTIGAGEHVAILGPNGCGKSTLVKTITRECYPVYSEATKVRILGRTHWDIFDLRNLLGIVSNDLMAQCTREITGFDVVLSGFFSSIGLWPNHEVSRGMREKTQEVLQLLEAEHLALKPVAEMSSGEARRMLIGRALVHAPKALLLDEPSTSLDLFAQHELRETTRKLARSGIGILLVTHQLSDVIPEIERVILMRDGGIVADGPKRDVLTAQALRSLFGVNVELSERDGYYHLW